MEAVTIYIFYMFALVRKRSLDILSSGSFRIPKTNDTVLLNAPRLDSRLSPVLKLESIQKSFI